MDDKYELFLSYAGRDTAAATATGIKATHYKELKKLLDDSMSV
jgi:2-oxoglutarate dehydrogenase complex dehydrogenase (E1) component-like enzyme